MRGGTARQIVSNTVRHAFRGGFWIASSRCKGLFLRSDFSSSKLVGLLGEWAPVDVEASGMDFAERLSLWLNAFDAIGLQAAHQSLHGIRTAAPQPAGGRPHRPSAIAEDFRRLRASLAHAIAQEPLRARVAADAAYAVYHQRHLELQRRMEQMIGPLRDHARQVLATVSPRLRQLAALDAVLEQVIAPREQLLLPTVAALMERRFEQLRLAQPGPEAARQHEDAARDDSDGWLHVFCGEWREALLAELDLRLEPLAGLVEALGNELKNQQ